MKTDEYKALDSQQMEELINGLKTVNNVEFNALKVIEEAGELTTLLTKSLSKIEELKPKDEELIEECGDLLLRLFVYIEHKGITNKVEERAEQKAALIYEALKAGKIGSTVTITKTTK